MFKKLSINIFLLLFAIVSSQTISPSGVTSTENYIYSRSYLEGVSSSSSSAKQIQGITYFDGLGRPKQTIAIKTTPAGKDMVTPIEYDGFGRQVKGWLPLPQTTTGDGAINTNPDTSFYSSFTGANLYSEKKLELSPLDRLQEQGHPGTDWNIGSTHSQKFEYDANGDNEVKKYTATFNYTTFTSSIALAPVTDTNANNGYYKAEQLYKNKITDEDGNISSEYKNAKGQTILVRKALNATQNADTYYVYNDYDQLAYVIPPLASNSTLSKSVLDNLCYQYKYDSQNRLVEKKLPGKGWEYMVYDQQDRLVLTQDAMLRGTVNNFAKRGWLFTKYDQFGRVVYTGFLANTATRETIQKSINSMVSNAANNETRSSSGFTQNALTVYYTKNAFPTGSMTVLSVNYYDTYPPDMVTPVPATIQGQTTLSAATTNGRSTKGLPMASYVKNIENDSWTKTYTFYDTKARAIGTYSQNHLGGYTKTETELDFAGVPQNTYTYHKRLSTDTEKQIKERFTYDSQNRLLQHYHQVNTNPEELLAENHYNELGQIDNKKVGNTAATPLQTVDYAYNIRGWMTQINNPTSLGTDVFGFGIQYQNPDASKSSATAKYNGNISQVDWTTKNSPGVIRTYTYQYDKLNRLTTSSLWDSMNHDRGEYQENLSYDLNGNITDLYRTGAYPSNGTAPQMMDDLQYYYEDNNTSNRLSYIKEKGTGNSLSGYPLSPGQTGQGFTYDANGNMTSQLDKNISSIQYNFLNLPNQVMQSGGNTGYVYRADGLKVKKTYGTKVTDYLDGFQYENNTLQFVPTAEGYYDFANSRYTYNYVDHLGNVRLSYYKNSAGVLTTLEESNYYPFGLKHEGYNMLAGNPAYKYKYNGKELQETGMYDYGARFYMPDIGRFGTIDPRSQYTHEAYSYVWNNPISFNDPTGMEGELATCPTCPKTSTYQPFIDDPNNTYVYDPQTKTAVKEKQIEEVVITVYRPIQVKPAEVELSPALALGAIEFGGSRSNNPYGWLAAGGAALLSYLFVEKVYQPISAYRAEQITYTGDNEQFLKDFSGVEDDGTDVNGVPVPIDDSGIKKPEDVLGGNKFDFAHKPKKQSTGKKGGDKHAKQYRHGGKNRPVNPNKRPGADRRRNNGRVND